MKTILSQKNKETLYIILGLIIYTFGLYYFISYTNNEEIKKQNYNTTNLNISDNIVGRKDFIVYKSENGVLSALDFLENYEYVWKTDISDLGLWDYFLFDDLIISYAVCPKNYCRGVYAFSQLDGSIVWQNKDLNVSSSDDAIKFGVGEDPIMFFISIVEGGHGFTALNYETGNIVWEQNTGDVFKDFYLDKDYAYLFYASNEGFMKINLDNGNIIKQ